MWGDKFRNCSVTYTYPKISLPTVMVFSLWLQFKSFSRLVQFTNFADLYIISCTEKNFKVHCQLTDALQFLLALALNDEVEKKFLGT